MDRSGKQIETIGEPARYTNLRLAPDEKRLAVVRIDAVSSQSDIWIFDLVRKAPLRFTTERGLKFGSIWSPDGTRIIFSSNRSGTADLYEKSTGGAGSDQIFLKSDEFKTPADWSADGRYVSYNSFNPKTRSDIWIVPATGDRKPMPLVHTDFNEVGGHFSGDSKFLAYASDESGQSEIYVQPFPPTGEKWRISDRGGGNPISWRQDGREIFYVNGRKIVSVDVSTAAGFKAGRLRELFEAPLIGGIENVAFSADGQKFIGNLLSNESLDVPITALINWTATLKK